jgi:hypothetical protein
VARPYALAGEEVTLVAVESTASKMGQLIKGPDLLSVPGEDGIVKGDALDSLGFCVVLVWFTCIESLVSIALLV